MFIFEEMKKMKKVLTILAVLIVLTSAVFADSEAHVIRVTADVTEVVPAFQLWLSVANDESAIDATTNGTPNSFENAKEYKLVDNATAVDTGFNLDEGGHVSVYAVLANKAKSNKAFTLTFSNGVFNVKKNGSSATLVPEIATTAGSVITGTSAIEKTSSATGAPVQVTFNGTTVTATDPKLATATYSYVADSAIDPGVYYADIVLTVATI